MADAQNGTSRVDSPLGQPTAANTTVELLEDPFSIHLMMVSLFSGRQQELLRS